MVRGCRGSAAAGGLGSPSCCCAVRVRLAGQPWPGTPEWLMGRAVTWTPPAWGHLSTQTPLPMGQPGSDWS